MSGIIVQQAKKIRDHITILPAEDGREALEFDFELEPERIIGRTQQALAALENAQNLVVKNPKSDELLTAYGNAVIALFSLLFGEENTAAVLEVYEIRFADMLADLLPVITDQIMPRLREASKAKAERLKAAAGDRA